jgi:AmmeMemoRadiSam system protein A
MGLPNSALPELDAEDRRRLLEIARQAIAQAVRERHGPQLSDPSGRLCRPAAVFVSLHKHRHLRGCIGHVTALEPLYRAVADAAVSAALQDPRFLPVRQDELDDLEIEISVLSTMLPVDPAQAEKLIEIGRHGLLVSRGRRRGLLLPQVAVEYGWTAREFLEETCLKANLPRDAWSSGAVVEMFSAVVFGEKKADAAYCNST